MSPHPGGVGNGGQPDDQAGTSAPEETAPLASHYGNARQADEDEEDEEKNEDEDEDEDDTDDEEPKLKYATLTRSQGAIYRNGDAASSFLVAGDKMIVGTHNGYMHVLSLPTMKLLRSFKAHSASVSMISVSPLSPASVSSKIEITSILGADIMDRSSRSTGPNSSKGTNKPILLPSTPENAIHIASASIDGNVCVTSLIDPKDVLLRNFGRPVLAVALSPEYRQNRSYISGGRAGQLVLTTGGRVGESTNANTTGAAAAAAGWLHNIGLGAGTGTDTVLHSGEGAITAIKWSLSGKYIVWVNETGIKFMRSNLHLKSHEMDFAWKRMNNIARPKGDVWDEMAGVWFARVEWVDEERLEMNEGVHGLPVRAATMHIPNNPTSSDKKTATSWNPKSKSKERVIIGWGGTIWIVDVHQIGTGSDKDIREKKIGRPEVVTILKTDCTISGVSQFTPNLIIVLAYLVPNNLERSKNETEKPKRGISRKQNAVQPEIRMIDINTQEEIHTDTLTFSRFESLSATDYHIGVLPVVREAAKSANQRGAFEVIGDVGGSIWDAALYSKKFFSSAASVASAGSTGDSVSVTGVSSSPARSVQKPHSALLTRGMKLFLQSPYDCVVATKLDMTDHLAWLYGRGHYEEAWNLLDEHPEAAGGNLDINSFGAPTASQYPFTPDNPRDSLADFLADDASVITGDEPDSQRTLAAKDKRLIADKWLQQLVQIGQWHQAGIVARKVLVDTVGWERWAWVFADAKRFREITDYLPREPMRPPLASTIYELFLSHYLHSDLTKFSELLDRWSPDLYEVASLVSAVESELKVGGFSEAVLEDKWRLLTDALARLYLADGRARDALKLYIRLKDADAAMSLVSSHSLLDAVMDDIPGLVLLRISKDKRKSAPISELEEASLEPIQLLVSETCQGLVRPESVLKKLSAKPHMQLYQFFYLRALWSGDVLERPGEIEVPRRFPQDRLTDRLATEGKSLVNDTADNTLDLFAEYDRNLLFEFLRTSQSYTLSKATSVCERKEYIPETVYLLAKEGQTKKALRLIIDKLGDVSQAISFAKEQNDKDLWNDLLDLSMKKPAFIRALLEEVGTAINPVTLIQRIPEGLEIIGLREALTRMIREYELQNSISEGAARVLRSEVADGLLCLRRGQKRGIMFEVSEANVQPDRLRKDPPHRQRVDEYAIKPGCCCICGNGLHENEPEPLLAFPCGHIFHIPCLTLSSNPPAVPSKPHSPASPSTTDKDPARLTTFPTLDELPSSITPSSSQKFAIDPSVLEPSDLSIGVKVSFARDLRSKRFSSFEQGCPLALHVVTGVDEV